MGNFVSKLFSHNDHDAEVKIKVEVNERKPSVDDEEYVTPKATPENVINPEHANVTPKTPKINKTISAIPKHLQIKPYLETDIDVVIPPLSPKKCMDPRSPNCALPRTPILLVDDARATTPEVQRQIKFLTPTDRERYKILGLDPRSPAADFDRTPLLLPRSLRRLRARSQENLSRRGSYETDVCTTPRYSYCETVSPFTTPEIQALPDIVDEGLRSLVLPQIENGNEGERSYSEGSSSSSDTNSEGEEVEVTVIKNPKFDLNQRKHVPSLVKLCTEKFATSIVENNLETKENIESDDNAAQKQHYGKTAELQPVQIKDNEGIKIWKDTVQFEGDNVEVTESSSQNIEEKQPQVPKEEIMIVYDDQTRSDDTRKKKKPLKLDSKVTMEKKKLFSPDNRSVIELQKNRTPLGNRSNSNQLQELPIKSPMRSKGLASRIQQENTPPHKKCVIKGRSNGSQWDPDSTVII